MTFTPRTKPMGIINLPVESHQMPVKIVFQRSTSSSTLFWKLIDRKTLASRRWIFPWNYFSVLYFTRHSKRWKELFILGAGGRRARFVGTSTKSQSTTKLKTKGKITIQMDIKSIAFRGICGYSTSFPKYSCEWLFWRDLRFGPKVTVLWPFWTITFVEIF